MTDTPKPPAPNEKTDLTVQDCLAGAFQALLRGDTAGRDALCAMAERAFQQHGNQPLPGDTPVPLGKEGAQ
jgi:hypothetical protein